MFGALYAADGSPIEQLLDVAREFSPRLDVCGSHVVLDLGGLERLFGDARTIGEALCRTAADRAVRVRVAIAGTRTAARLVVAAGSGQQPDSRKPSPLDSRSGCPEQRRRAGFRTVAGTGGLKASGCPATCRPPADVIVIAPGAEAAALAPLPIEWLAVVADTGSHPSHPHPFAPRTLAPSHDRTAAPVHDDDLETFRRWGLRTLGDLSGLPADAVAARLGPRGVRWQRLARGEDLHPLVPAAPEERFEQALDLEWPIEGLEPLSFVLGRLMEPLAAHLERRGRGAAVLHVRLHLVTRAVYERSLQLPAPMRDARTLRTLALLDLESHPPAAAIDRVVVAVDPTPGRVVQYSLLARPLPSPEQLSTLLARLAALMGEERCGSPADVDSWQPGACAMKPFAPQEGRVGQVGRVGEVGPAACPPAPLAPPALSVALRRFRHPVPARVRVDQGTLLRVATDRPGLSGGRVERCAGPWRTSGGWWADGAGKAGGPDQASTPLSHPPHPPHWDRDEWDVSLSDGATYRVFRERATDAWCIEGVYD